MLVMSGLGAVLAVFMPSWISVVAGCLAFYLTATAWMTVKRPEGVTGHFEVGALSFVALLAVGGLSVGWLASNSPDGRLNGLPAAPAYIFGSVAGLAAALDLWLIRRGGLSGTPRIARHLWRMCAALLIAASAFFNGQQKVMPEAMRGSPALSIPVLLVLAAMIFWLIRVRVAARGGPAKLAAGRP